MDQEPATSTPETADGKPKFWSGINGVIAGLTGLVVAVGGLVTAYNAMRGDKPAEERAAETAVAADADITKTPLEQPQALSAAETAAPAARPDKRLYTGDLFHDGKFAGGAMSLKHNGENWILTADQPYEYEQMVSPDPDRILAYNADYGSYLRWPVKGGEVEESVDKRKSWSRYAKVTASNPSSD